MFRWFIEGPGDIVLGLPNEVNNQGETYDGSMLTNMFVVKKAEGNELEFHFKVREAYDLEKKDNTIHLHIRTTNAEFIVDKVITFTKDGSQGTNGTDWSAPLFPCNYMDTYSSANSDNTSY